MLGDKLLHIADAERHRAAAAYRHHEVRETGVGGVGIRYPEAHLDNTRQIDEIDIGLERCAAAIHLREDVGENREVLSLDEAIVGAVDKLLGDA